MEKLGKVYLVGAGPGTPDLITVRGQSLLANADVVLFDALSHPGLLALASPHAELRDVGKRGGSISPTQDWITQQLIELAQKGKTVVRLKGGDSYLFARGAEEAEALVDASIPFEVVPGLSSPVGTSAYAGIPLTHRDLSSSVAFITGTDKAGKEWSDQAWLHIATATDTLCILMGMRRLNQICDALIRGGRAPNTPAAVIMWGARPVQRVCRSTLSDLPSATRRAGLTNPAVIVVGDVVALRDKLNWFEQKPLFGRRILVPRPVHQAAETARQIRERGGEAVVYPVIEIHPPPDPAALLAAAAAVQRYDWVLFTSVNAVDAFFSALREQGFDARRLANCRVAAIGPRTGKALEACGIAPDVTAPEFVGEGLAQAVLTAGGGRHVLLPRALEAREELPTLLRQAGFGVDIVPAYQTKAIGADKAAALRHLFEQQEVDTVLFTSSSMVESTMAALASDAAHLLAGVQLASIGPITSATVRRHGLRVDVEASVYTIPGLLDTLSLQHGNGTET